MKICILTPRFPFPENGGDVLRINNIARYLKTKNHNLILVSFCEKKIDLKNEYYELYDSIHLVKRNKIESLIMSFLFMLTGRPIQCGYYFSNKYLSQLKKIIRTEVPDEFISHLSRMVPYLKLTRQQPNSIIEMTDALSKTYRLATNAKGNFIKKSIYKVELGLIRRYEKYVIKNFPKVVLVSDSDVKYLREESKEHITSLAVYTNGVECLPEINAAYDSNTICFVGNMRTLQNQDAVIHFVNDIFPIIKKSIPDAVFKIVGAQPSEKILSLADEQNIIVTGFVDDIQKTISECCLNVAPVRVAAGIQNKVLVAMGCGVPVVLSSLISNAIPELHNEENCYIIDNDKLFAEECIEIMKNKELRMRISRSGFETVEKHYSWQEKLEGYEII